MERLTVDKTVVRAVEKIPWQRMPDGFHMDADLVCPSCLQEEADEGEVSVLVVGKCPVMGHSGLTPLWIQTRSMVEPSFLAIGRSMVPDASVFPETMAAYSL